MQNKQMFVQKIMNRSEFLLRKSESPDSWTTQWHQICSFLHKHMHEVNQAAKQNKSYHVSHNFVMPRFYVWSLMHTTALEVVHKYIILFPEKKLSF